MTKDSHQHIGLFIIGPISNTVTNATWDWNTTFSCQSTGKHTLKDCVSSKTFRQHSLNVLDIIRASESHSSVCACLRAIPITSSYISRMSLASVGDSRSKITASIRSLSLVVWTCTCSKPSSFRLNMQMFLMSFPLNPYRN